MLLIYCILVTVVTVVTVVTTKLTQQPNIIYILCDDLGHADVGFTSGAPHSPSSAPHTPSGAPHTPSGAPHTPALNKLAKEGVQLTQFYVQQVCTPTRGALMTGDQFIQIVGSLLL